MCPFSYQKPNIELDILIYKKVLDQVYTKLYIEKWKHCSLYIEDTKNIGCFCGYFLCPQLDEKRKKEQKELFTKSQRVFENEKASVYSVAGLL